MAGTVRLSVADIIGIEVLPQMLAPLRQAHPALELELVLSNASADILHQEADIAIRMHPPRQEALIARHVGRIPLGFYAAPDYVARHGLPETLADLARHVLIGPDRSAADLGFAAALSAQAGLKLPFAIRTDSHPAQLAAARAGLGIAVAQVAIGARDLVRVLPDLELPALGCGSSPMRICAAAPASTGCSSIWPRASRAIAPRGDGIRSRRDGNRTFLSLRSGVLRKVMRSQSVMRVFPVGRLFASAFSPAAPPGPGRRSRMVS